MSWYTILKFLGVAVAMIIPVSIAMFFEKQKEEGKVSNATTDSEDEQPEFTNPVATVLYVGSMYVGLLFGVLAMGGLVHKLIKFVMSL